jgi:hypothetical protein
MSCPPGCAASKADDAGDSTVAETPTVTSNVNGAKRVGAVISGLVGPFLLLLARQLN